VLLIGVLAVGMVIAVAITAPRRTH